jgi:O-antigen ligase
MLNRVQDYLQVSFRNNAERTAFILLAGSISLVLASIAVSQILLFPTVIAAAWLVPRNRKLFSSVKRILLPLGIFCAWILLTALLAPNVALALTITKKFYLFLIIPLVPLLARGQNRLLWIYRAILAVALLSSLVGIGQYLANSGNSDLMHRISGFMGHWMTFSGLLMLALVCTVAYGLHTGWKWIFLWGAIAGILALAILLSQTRNAALGAFAGVFVLLAATLAWERKRRFIIFTLCFILLSVSVYFAAPASLRQRFQSGFDPADPNTRNRIELFETSIRMIRDNPWFGVGPKNVKFEALKYRGRNEFPDWMYQHMHNNFLQIASAMGIPGLALWLWVMIQLAWDSLRTYRFVTSSAFPCGEKARREATLVCSAALGCWVALLTAGLFEYNFGDSEILTLFLFIMSAPYAYSPKVVSEGDLPGF